jgi:hypothetical protein
MRGRYGVPPNSIVHKRRETASCRPEIRRKVTIRRPTAGATRTNGAGISQKASSQIERSRLQLPWRSSRTRSWPRSSRRSMRSPKPRRWTRRTTSRCRGAMTPSTARSTTRGSGSAAAAACASWSPPAARSVASTHGPTTTCAQPGRGGCFSSQGTWTRRPSRTVSGVLCHRPRRTR